MNNKRLSIYGSTIPLRKNRIILNVVQQGEDVDSGVREERYKQFCERIFAEKLNVSDVKIEKIIRIGKTN